MISEINHITLATTNLDVSFSFYLNILGFKPLVKWDKGAYFLVGEQDKTSWFCLSFDLNHTHNKGYTHYAFSVDKESFGEIKNKIVESGAKSFKENSSPGDSFYFLDPDGHKLEIHSGDWLSRIAAKKERLGSWKDVQWFV